MSGKSSDGRKISGKNKIQAVATPLSTQEDLLLSTRHQILMEDYESLKQDYASLEQRFKLVEEMNQMMKPFQNQNQAKELEATNQRLLKDLERERNEKNEYKKMVEEMKRMESESKATINELMITNEELLNVIEKEEEELKKKENKYDELARRFGKIEEECLHLKTLYDAMNLTGQGRNDVAFDDDVFVVDEPIVNNNNTVAEKNVNSNTVDDAIVISDESDAECDNPPRTSNINLPLPVFIKQEQECSNGVNSPQVNHPSSRVKLPSWSSSSSSSSDEIYECLVPLKKSRVDYNKF